MVAAKEVLVSQMALRLESVHIWKWAQIGSLPKHMGTTSFLPPASRVRGQEHHHSCHLLPESKEGQGRHQSTFRFCSGITQLSPALFQLGQQPLNHKHFHAQHTLVLAGPLHPAVQGAPSTSSPTVPWEHLALASHLCGLLAPFFSSQMSAWM